MKPDISKDVEELSRKVADWMVQYIMGVLARQDRFTISLSGGNTPRQLFRLLASDPYRNKIAWEKMHVFWGDERFVPATDERNNAKMAFEELLDHVPIDRRQIHVMNTTLTPEDAAIAYEKILHDYFDENVNSFDLVLLGLGDDAHTLSLFPGYSIVHEKNKWVCAFYFSKQDMYRISLTAPIVNRASMILFLVSGADKAVAIDRVLYGEHDPDLYPAQMIQPYNGACKWYLDKAAATELNF
jgi:6-phosphogluconolactonase